MNRRHSRATGIQYNMSGEIRLLIGFLDSRYDEKYGR